MRLLTKSTDVNHLHILKDLLEANGIPAVIQGENIARMISPFLMTEPSLWVYVDEQLVDAEQLLLDPDHEVQNKIDVDEFYSAAAKVSENPKQFNDLLLNYGVGCAIFLAVVNLIFTWLDA